MSVHRLQGGQLLCQLDEEKSGPGEHLKSVMIDAAAFLLTFLLFGVLTLDVLVKVRG